MDWMYKTRDGEVRCGSAPTLEAMRAKHWVDPDTVRPAPRLPKPGRDIVDYDAGTVTNPREAEEAAEAQDKSTLREQILAATEAQWLGLTEAQRQKTVLKALKYLAMNF